MSPGDPCRLTRGPAGDNVSPPSPDRREFLSGPRPEGPGLLSRGGQTGKKLSVELPAIDLSPAETRKMEFAPLPPRIEEGTLIGGFEVLEELRSGSLASVYRAHQLSRDRQVALKVLSPHLLHVADAVSRFRREARLAGRVTHPGIVPVHEYSFDGTYHHYAMKLVTEPTLVDLVDSAFGNRDDSFFRDAALLFAALCRTVAALHAGGIVHQDIKPGNVFVVAPRRPLLFDFGAATEIGPGGHSAGPDENAVGTPAYMAPERFIPARSPPDPRSDIYSLGVSLYELISGVLPFPPCPDEDMARLKLTRKPPSPRKHETSVPLGLEAIVRQALDIRPELRHASAVDMARDLERFARNRRTNTRSHPGLGGYSAEDSDDRDDPDPELARLV